MSLKRQAITGVKWSFVQQLSVQIINFGVQVILARLLTPEMFGLIAMVIVFVSIGATLMDSGMTSSLIRTKTPEQKDYSTVFVTNLIVSCSVYGLVFIAAPYIAAFYKQAVLTDIVRVLALSFVIRSFVAVHVAKLTKEMNFKLQMQLQIPSAIIGGGVGVSMAYTGYEVWSLVWLNLAQALVFTVQNWLFIPWKPSLVFDKEKFKHHFRFGYKLTLASLIDTIFNDVYRIVIGKFYSPVQVGYFHQAEMLRLFPVQQLSAVLGKVTYPYFSNINSDASLKSAYKKTMKLVISVTFPVMLVLILLAEELIRFLLGEKWLPAAPYLQILATASIIRPVSVYNLNILKVKGRSDLLLIIEVVKKALGVCFLAAGLAYGVMGIVVSLVLFSFSSYIINSSVSGSIINYPLWAQLKDMQVVVVVGLAVYLFIYSIKGALGSFNYPDFLLIIVFGMLTLMLCASLSVFFDKDLKRIVWSLRK
ncbi:lipopolysaccharide biosynthesis protein [uncultured Halomonas sp.]|uniref:lipopolysaccharide biosynthesis protein n=1 Tax=uncultured Halomonas sp. TaxID=173971 RepID=UPI00261734B6|nr:lipopolysaccharide biosynthesis protein [uncultured Halomonas sp.]